MCVRALEEGKASRLLKMNWLSFLAHVSRVSCNSGKEKAEEIVKIGSKEIGKVFGGDFDFIVFHFNEISSSSKIGFQIRKFQM